ncbi:serine hydrolase domain-containing protein [Micromonospora endophytica]|uniref:Penicillin-binding protein n=1 Tax=Micromonospora endophytica TaxID=515350 RepID=A0A2W2BUJ2_9ACTN|nr:serine hydrolase domain-containing protein [Micromonospora endophytica]PZF89792.1 penicillin-binding protein [Micromonospora endophytica]RIW40251.1 class A beta-lactamase-related serine hydrolase [Micromonospora endophytica]BCJ61969.1 serine hydrolase [Micromonospora endophytica]
MRKPFLAALALTLTVAGAAPAWGERPAAVPTPAVIDAYLREALDSTGLPGLSAVVTHGDRIVHGTGLGRDASGRSVTADTPMRVASVSKSFTAAAIMTLVDEGRVALDQPVATYLPEFRMADPRAGRVTVRQLLNQTSGLSDRSVDIGATQRATSLAGYLAALRHGRLAGEPGARWEYCNVNYDVAARLVEVVDGRDFADAMRDRVFGRLGMDASAVGDRVVRPSDGFVSVFGAWLSRAELPGFRGGAGGIVTSASDMGRWLISQTGHGPQVVTPGSLAALHQPPPGGDYALGWGVETVAGRPLLVHSGNLFTYTAVQAVDPATGFGFAVMTNSASLHDDTYQILLGLVALADGRQPTTPGGGRQTTEWILAAIALVALALGLLGVRRSGHWARRRAGRAWWWTVLRMAGVLMPAAVLATYPQWVSLLMNGRAVTWAQLTYFPAPLTITLAVAAAAGLATATARLIRLFRPGHDRPTVP